MAGTSSFKRYYEDELAFLRELGGEFAHAYPDIARELGLAGHDPDVERLLDQALRSFFGIAAPRIAITGLNPHAGENGSMGREEIETITPAIRRLQAEIDRRASTPDPEATSFGHEANAPLRNRVADFLPRLRAALGPAITVESDYEG